MIAGRVSPASVTSAKRQLYADLLHHNVGTAIETSKELIAVMMTQPGFKKGVAAPASPIPPSNADHAGEQPAGGAVGGRVLRVEPRAGG